MSSINFHITLTIVALIVILATDRVCARAGLNGAMLRSYFGCPVCDLNECPPLPGSVENGCIPIKESGICGCCMVCARLEHEQCGIYTARCAPGLQCKPDANLVDKQSEFFSLWEGQGVCTQKSNQPGKCSFVCRNLCEVNQTSILYEYDR